MKYFGPSRRKPYIPDTVIDGSSCLSDLDEIKSSLKRSKDIRGIKKVLFRMDLVQKVKQYDSKLANVLHTFHVRNQFTVHFPRLTSCLQVKLTLDIRLAQLAEEHRHRVRCVGPMSTNHNQLTSSIIGDPRWFISCRRLVRYCHVRVFKFLL